MKQLSSLLYRNNFKFYTLLGSKYVQEKDEVTIIHQNESFKNNSYLTIK